MTSTLSVLHDYLKNMRPKLAFDNNRIAVSGHSLGAKTALLMGVLDATLAAVVWNDSINFWKERSIVRNLPTLAPYQYVPGFLEWFDYVDLQASLAPRPFLIGEGGRKPAIDRIRKAYQLMGAEDHIKVAYYPGYATPELRSHDHEEIPVGLSQPEYKEYANVDSAAHYFKKDVAVPWLKNVLKQTQQ